MDKNRVYTTKEIERIVDEYISQFEEGYFSPLSLMARLSEEVGELAREINHYYGEKPKKVTEHEKTIEEELGDLLFVIACFANSLNVEKKHEKSIHQIRVAQKGARQRGSTLMQEAGLMMKQLEQTLINDVHENDINDKALDILNALP